MRQTVRAILLNNQNLLLLVQHAERDPNDQGKWATVGGGIDGNEDHQQCLRREIAEELGDTIALKITIGPKLFSSHRLDRVDHFYVVWFDGRDVKVVSPEEILRHGWFSQMQVDQLPLFFGFEADLFAKAVKLVKPSMDL